MEKTFCECKVTLHDWIVLDKLNWCNFCRMNHDGVIQLLSQHPDGINSKRLSCNAHPTAIKWMRENPDKINVNVLTENPNPEALELLEQYIHKLTYWWIISQAIHI